MKRVYRYRTFVCPSEHQTVTLVETTVFRVPCQRCDEDAVLPELAQGVSANLNRDECDYIDHNLGPEPIRITSWSQRRRLMEAQGLEDACRYVAPPDEAEPNPQGPSNWGARTDAYTAENVRILLERAFQQGPAELEDALNVRTYIR